MNACDSVPRDQRVAVSHPTFRSCKRDATRLTAGSQWATGDIRAFCYFVAGFQPALKSFIALMN